MNNKSGRILSLVIMAGLVLWCLHLYWDKHSPPKMNFLAAAFTNVDTKEKISLAEQAGKVLIVSCFQTWCRDCAKETAILNDLAKEYGPEKFRVIYITDEANKKLETFRSRLASDEIIFAVSAKPLSALNVHVYPTTFLLDKKGNVILTKLEGYDWKKEAETIRMLLAK